MHLLAWFALMIDAQADEDEIAIKRRAFFPLKKAHFLLIKKAYTGSLVVLCRDSGHCGVLSRIVQAAYQSEFYGGRIFFCGANIPAPSPFLSRTG